MWRQRMNGSKPPSYHMGPESRESSKRSPVSDALGELKGHLDKEWKEDDDRISVVVNTGLPQARSMFPQKLTPKTESSRWLVTLTLIFSALMGALKLVYDTFF